MFWVIQNNIYREQKHSTLIETLETLSIPHVEVKVVPFYDKLLPSDFDSHGFTGSIDEVEEVKIDDSGDVMVLGATSLTRIAKERGWEPGSFLNENFHYSNWLSAYESDLLNEEAVVEIFRMIDPPWDEFFIRPCEDTKHFNGTVMTKEEFFAWRHELLENDGTCDFADHDVVASPVQHIHAEYRFFVVNKKVVTYSQYKDENGLSISPYVPNHIVSFAQKMVDIWQPADAFVIDIAQTDNGLKVIEINNFNSAGFYAADVKGIIYAIENMR